MRKQTTKIKIAEVEWENKQWKCVIQNCPRKGKPVFSEHQPKHKYENHICNFIEQEETTHEKQKRTMETKEQTTPTQTCM